MPAKHKKSGDRESAEINIKEYDPIPDKIKGALAGTIMCNVRAVTSKWPDAINHDIDNTHIKHLKKIFTAGLHCHLPENHLKLTLSTNEWDTLLAFLITGIQENTITSLSTNNNITKDTL